MISIRPKTKFRAQEINFDAVCRKSYDVGFFGCGYEERCTYIPRKLNRSQLGRSYALLHTGSPSSEAQIRNKAFFQREFPSQAIEMASEDESELYELCRSIALKETTRILVDYSSMSKLWYNGILNWAEFAFGGEYSEKDAEIEIDFVYAIGEYKSEFTPLTIGEIAPLPGRDATHLTRKDTVALFGLGFDHVVVESVYDRIEPDHVHAFIASPGASPSDTNKVLQKNNLFVEDYVRQSVFQLPLRSVTTTANSLYEIAIPYLEEFNLLLIPLGPKPHVLASLLLCMEFPRSITCLRVEGERTEAVDVGPKGEVVATSVTVALSAEDG